MKDLIVLIDQISELMYNYDQDFDEFVDNSASNMKATDACIEKMRGLAERHSKTVRDLSRAAIEIDDFTTEHEHGAATGSYRSNMPVGLVMIMGAGATHFYPLGGLALMAAFGVYAIGQVAQSKSIRVKRTAKLEGVQGCHEELSAPLQKIFDELLNNKKKSAMLLSGSWEYVTGHKNDERIKAAYCRTQMQAKEIIDRCLSIRTLTGRIFILRGIAAARLEEFTAQP